MSDYRKSEISGILSRWLERYSPPQSIKGNERAQQDEAEALLSVLLRFAPQQDAGAWAHRALERLEYQMKTRAWPTKGELGAVCSNLRKEGNRDGNAETFVMPTPAEINAKRMMAGEPVGEAWLYGTLAAEMIKLGIVDLETMTKYRSGAFLARKKVYGEAAALEWEADAKERHEEARKRQTEPTRRDLSMPDKREVYEGAA